MTTIQLNRKTENITITDSYGNPVLSWEIATDDKSMEAMLQKVASSLSRFAAIQKQIDEALDEGEEARAKEAMARLIQRLISAILGADAWQDILCYIGDGEAVNPQDYIMDLGEIFAALATWLYHHCTSEQLRAAGALFDEQNAKPVWQPRPAKKKKGKRK